VIGKRKSGFRQGSFSAEISNPFALMISLRSLSKEKYPLWTPPKEKRKA
jgi:hypothetical protein